MDGLTRDKDLPPLGIDEAADKAKYVPGTGNSKPTTKRGTRRNTAAKDLSAVASLSTVSLAEIRKALMELYTYAAMATMMKNEKIALTIIENSEACADSLIAAAEKNPAFRRTLSRLVSVGTYGGIVAAHFPILMVIATEYIPQMQKLSPMTDAFTGQNPAEDSAA